MKVGAENRTKVILAIALGVVLLIVIATQMGGWFGGASSSAAAPPVPRVTTATEDLPARRTGGRARTAATKKDTAARSMDPSLRLDLLKASEDTKYEGTGRNIFRVFVEIPKIRQPPLQSRPHFAECGGNSRRIEQQPAEHSPNAGIDPFGIG